MSEQLVEVAAGVRRKRRRPVTAVDLEDFFENGAVPLHLVGGDGTILRANKAELSLLGYTADEYVGRHIAQFHADEQVIEEILKRLSSGQKLDRYPASLRAKDGSLKEVEITSSVCFRDGKFINTRCFSYDVTAMRAAEKAVQEKEIRLQQILDALPAAVYTTDAQGKVTYFNPAAEQLAGRTPLIGTDEWCVTWRLRDSEGQPLAHEACPMAVALKEERPIRGIQAFAERPDGRIVPFEPYPTPLFDSTGKLSGAVNMLIDLTNQKAREKHIEFVMRELSHRSKNLLAVVQAIASRSLKSSADTDEFETKFMARIQTMARTHDILVKNDWSGVCIKEIVALELQILDHEQAGDISIKGGSITLSPTVAQNVGLAIHELLTNALKYGALSHEGGRIEIAWALDNDALQFSWKEEGGRAAKKTEKKGFGSTMLAAVCKDANFAFGPSGLHFTGLIPFYSQQ